jgi:chromosome segregation protein
MRLASIKIAGFKSFVEPSKIPFPDQMTCVVGPNGCGKSNVIDAVRWVLGESSAKNLRGDAMTDVIFNGSTERKPVSQASVELLFDNTEGRLPGTLASRNQIAIKRLVTREGVSQYYLNGEKCRKRDITDIFLGTGLGPRSYAIIEQGMISRLIESKPQDLRIFLEEAAGVSKYKERRRETQTRLNSTRDNLERLLDLRNELENQLNVLTEQADKARIYTTAKSKERTLKAQICVLKWQSLQQKLLESEAKLSDIDEQIGFLIEAHTGHDDVISALKLAIEQANDLLNDAQHQEFQLRNKLARDEQDKIHKQAQKVQLIQRIDHLQKQFKQLDQDQLETKENYQDQQEQLALCQAELAEYEELVELSLAKYEEQKAQQDELYSAYQVSLGDNNGLLQEQQSLQSSLSSLEVKEARLTQQKLALCEQKAALTEQYAALETKLATFKFDEIQDKHEQVSNNLSELNKEVATAQKALAEKHTQMTEAEHQLQSLLTKRDALALVLNEHNDNSSSVADLLPSLIVGQDWHLAVEASLFNLRFAHRVEQLDQDLIQPQVWQQAMQVTIGSLAEKVFEGVYPSYFNLIAVVEDVNALNGNFWQGEFHFAVDSKGNLRGENWFLPCQFDRDNSLLVKHQLLKEIALSIPESELQLQSAQKTLTAQQSLVESLQSQQKELNSAFALIDRELTQSRAEYSFSEKRFDEINLQLNTVSNKQAELEAQLQLLSDNKTPLVTELEDIIKKQAESKERQTRFEAAYHNAKLVTRQLQTAFEGEKSQCHKVQLHLQTMQNQIVLSESKLNQFSTRYDELNEQLEEAKLTLEDVQMPLVELDETIAEQHLLLEQQIEQKQQKQLALEDAKEKLKQAESGIGSEQEKLESLKQIKQSIVLEQQGFQIKSEAALAPLAELNTQLKDVIADLPEDAKLTTLQGQLSKVSNEISQLGAINLAAIEEFDKASTRKNYLDQQYDDLVSALKTLESAIIKIDRETKQRFKATFDQVNSGLQDLFPKVFGGGSAYLELTSDDLLETGVAIMARPPGKKNATIHLLSGGEKALTALSLVFSIFQLNPAPFCMLDEVDAPLDDANVGRFCRLVEEMSQDVQFVYISHNKIAMEMAARLTGVTMAEPGVSRVVAVDIEKALEMSESA